MLKQARQTRQIRFEHIKSHSNDKGNDAADELANKGAKNKICRTTDEWEHIKHTHPEIPEKTVQRKATTLPHWEPPSEKPTEIRIPIPSYKYGACRRDRFAFGRVTTAQARTNTAEYFRSLEKDKHVQLDTNLDNPEPQEENLDTGPEWEEEDPFQNNDLPNLSDCA